MKLDEKKLSILIMIIILFLVVIYFMFFGGSSITVEEDKGLDGSDNDPVLEEIIEKTLGIIDLDSNSRSIGVMINNYGDAQPYQTGVNEAYITYELITEGGITRMLSLFRDVDSSLKVGTIRSSREYFLDYNLENDAIYVHFGGSEQALSDIVTLGINNVNGIRDDFYWREDFPISSEHTVYSDFSKINSVISNMNYRTTSDVDLLLNYSIESIDLGLESIVANEVNIKFSSYQTNNWKYNIETMLYEKYSNGNIRKDYITKEVFIAKNIITYEVDYYTIDSYGRQAISNLGSGIGYFITEGKAVEIMWKKDSRTGQTKYYYLDGSEIVVNDGNTHIQISSTSGSLVIN